MKNIFNLLMGVVLFGGIFSCRSTKKLQTAVNKKDTVIAVNNVPSPDSLKGAKDIFASISKNKIDLQAF